MNIGLIISEMKKEIKSSITNPSNVDTVLGFGSFFEGKENYKDVDVAVIIKEDEENLKTYYEFEKMFISLTKTYKKNFHFVFFIASEVECEPLSDMENMVVIFSG